MSRRTLILWSFCVVVLIVSAFGFSIFYSVDRVVKKLGVTGADEVFTDGGNLAVLDIKGVIDDPEEVLQDIEELQDKSGIKAVVVRISSPGGSVGPTQEIFNALTRLREHKKVYCSFGDVAASGGYYIAAACEKIFANPGTLTGSIGVIMHFFNLKDLYSWAKVQPVVLKAGKFKDMGSENRAMTEDEKALLQDMLDDVHTQFKDAVRTARKLKADVVNNYADGRIFSGAQAKKLGFVDELGGEFETIAAVAKAAGIHGDPEVVRREDHSGRRRFSQFFEGKSLVEGALSYLLNGSAAAPQNQFQLKEGVPYYLPPSFVSGPRQILNSLSR